MSTYAPSSSGLFDPETDGDDNASVADSEGTVARAEGMLMADELQQLADHHFFGGEKPTIEGLAV